MDGTKLKRQLKRFEEHLIVDKGLGKVTVAGYCRVLSLSLRRMRKYVPRYKDIKTHILWMHGKNYSYSHIVNTSLALEHYAKFKGFHLRIGRPKKPTRVAKDSLSESEVSRLIHSTKDIRERSLVALLAYSGIRNQEICNLRVKDIDLGGNGVIVLGGKNRKDRVVNMSPHCANMLVEYLQRFPRQPGDYLFSTLRRGNQLATNDVRKLVRITAKRAEINRRVHPHLFRISLATNLLNRGAKLMTIKDQLGHAHLATVLQYFSSTVERSKTEYEFYLPAYL
jgi:integrase/recombinase XerD